MNAKTREPVTLTLEEFRASLLKSLEEMAKLDDTAIANDDYNVAVVLAFNDDDATFFLRWGATSDFPFFPGCSTKGGIVLHRCDNVPPRLVASYVTKLIEKDGGFLEEMYDVYLDPCVDLLDRKRANEGSTLNFDIWENTEWKTYTFIDFYDEGCLDWPVDILGFTKDAIGDTISKKDARQKIEEKMSAIKEYGINDMLVYHSIASNPDEFEDYFWEYVCNDILEEDDSEE